MTKTLQQYFPMIRSREDIENEINQSHSLASVFHAWKPEQQEEFLNFCSGARGIKILYDSFFKEAMNPEYAPERMESFLSTILKREVKIVQILPNDSTRIADESSLLITDIIVQLEDGSLANIEMQKIGYSFPGARSACYSSDMLLRQYKRIRSRNEKTFSYQQIKNVYLIVIYEQSPRELKEMPDTYYHHSRQVFDSGLKLNLLQEYIMIPLDIFHARVHNEDISNLLDAWLTFLSDDRPEQIIRLITKYPQFKAMYDTLYEMCRNVERVMQMFSKELLELDRNTVKYMIEEQQKELEEKDAIIAEKDSAIAELQAEIARLKGEANK